MDIYERTFEQQDLPFVSIIVLTYNSRKHLRTCFESLYQTEYPNTKYEVIMADNNSKDNSIKFVKNNFSWVKIIPFKKNYGFAAGNNRAVTFANGDYIAFINPDTKVDKHWLIHLVHAIDSGETDLAACGSKIMFFKNNKIVQIAGTKMCPHGGGYNIGYGEKDNPKFDKFRYTMSLPGCAMLIKKKTFLAIGGFDPDYFMYIEEFDLGFRLWISGYKCLYVPTSIVYHKMSEHYKLKLSSFTVYHECKNRMATILKNFEWKNVIKGILISLLYAIFSMFYYVYKRKNDFSKSLIKGLVDSARDLSNTMAKRKIVQGNRKICDKDLKEFGLFATTMECCKELKRTMKYR